jgi:4-amino-4-deoxy-L-arabinose transferase-like glycosyltransferase
VVSYAPPGFPILVGLAFLGLGVSDVPAIFVSVLAGTMTIPATAWLARRTFGAGAGAAAAAFVTTSGFHLVFSRMALTDALSLLFWVLGLICGQRFLERPGILAAVALGASTGLAQLIKYNGWLIGGFVILAALAGLVLDHQERSRGKLLAVWGYGLLAAFLAALIYWPWFRFVETHGGYSHLLQHQRGYTGGSGTWLPHLRAQLDQVAALSGGSGWVATGYVSALVSSALAAGVGADMQLRRLTIAVTIAVVIGAAFVAFPPMFWMVGLSACFGLRTGGPGRRLVGVSWLGLSLITPFYHPYARLWLPAHLMGLLAVSEYLKFTFSKGLHGGAGGQGTLEEGTARRRLILGSLPIAVIFLVVFGPHGRPNLFAGPGECPGPLAATDSLRLAVNRTVADLQPQATPRLRLLARPSVTFYLGGRIPVQVEPNLARLLEPANPSFWALVDQAQLRQEGDLNASVERLLSHWVLLKEYPTELNLPTLLDVDPGAALRGRSDARFAPLWLLRPRPQGPS